MLDQPMGYVQRMNVALNVYTAFKRRNDAKDMKVFSEQYPDLWELTAKIERLRVEHDQ